MIELITATKSFGVQGPYSQHFIFFTSHKWVQRARVFLPGDPFQPSETKNSSLLGPCLSYEENKVF
jgi:hypothetical protein